MTNNAVEFNNVRCLLTNERNSRSLNEEFNNTVLKGTSRLDYIDNKKT